MAEKDFIIKGGFEVDTSDIDNAIKRAREKLRELEQRQLQARDPKTGEYAKVSYKNIIKETSALQRQLKKTGETGKQFREQLTIKKSAIDSVKNFDKAVRDTAKDLGKIDKLRGTQEEKVFMEKVKNITTLKDMMKITHADQITGIKGIRQLEEERSKQIIAAEKQRTVELKKQAQLLLDLVSMGDKLTLKKLGVKTVGQRMGVVENLSRVLADPKDVQNIEYLNKQVRKVGETYLFTGTAMAKARKRSQDLGTTLLWMIKRHVEWVATGAVLYKSVQALSVSFSEAIKLETTMAMVAAAANAPIRELQGELIKLSAQSIFSANELGKAAEVIVKAGIGKNLRTGTLDVKKITDIMKTSMIIAEVEGSNLNETMEKFISIANQFNIPYEQINRIAGVLAITADATLASVGSLSKALATVGPVAESFGMSLEETTAILGIFQNRGIEAGTSARIMRQMLIQLKSPTKEAKDTMAILNKELGANVKSTDKLIDYIDKLSGVWPKLTKAEQEHVATTFSTNRSIIGMILTLRTLKDEFPLLMKAMDDWGEALERRRRLMEDTAEHQIKKLKNAFTSLGILLAETLIPTIKRFVEHISFIPPSIDSIGDALRRVVAPFTWFLETLGKASPLLERLGWAFGVITEKMDDMSYDFAVQEMLNIEKAQIALDDFIETKKAYKKAGFLKKELIAPETGRRAEEVRIAFEKIGVKDIESIPVSKLRKILEVKTKLQQSTIEERYKGEEERRKYKALYESLEKEIEIQTKALLNIEKRYWEAKDKQDSIGIAKAQEQARKMYAIILEMSLKIGKMTPREAENILTRMETGFAPGEGDRFKKPEKDTTKGIDAIKDRLARQLGRLRDIQAQYLEDRKKFATELQSIEDQILSEQKGIDEKRGEIFAVEEARMDQEYNRRVYDVIRNARLKKDALHKEKTVLDEFEKTIEKAKKIGDITFEYTLEPGEEAVTFSIKKAEEILKTRRGELKPKGLVIDKEEGELLKAIVKHYGISVELLDQRIELEEKLRPLQKDQVKIQTDINILELESSLSLNNQIRLLDIIKEKKKEELFAQIKLNNEKIASLAIDDVQKPVLEEQNRLLNFQIGLMDKLTKRERQRLELQRLQMLPEYSFFTGEEYIETPGEGRRERTLADRQLQAFGSAWKSGIQGIGSEISSALNDMMRRAFGEHETFFQKIIKSFTMKLADAYINSLVQNFLAKQALGMFGNLGQTQNPLAGAMAFLGQTQNPLAGAPAFLGHTALGGMPGMTSGALAGAKAGGALGGAGAGAGAAGLSFFEGGIMGTLGGIGILALAAMMLTSGKKQVSSSNAVANGLKDLTPQIKRLADNMERFTPPEFSFRSGRVNLIPGSQRIVNNITMNINGSNTNDIANAITNKIATISGIMVPQTSVGVA